MVLQGPPVQRHEVEVLTPHFQISGQVEVAGPVFEYINGASRHSLVLRDVHLRPLTPGIRLRGFSRLKIVLRRPEIVFLYLTSAEARASIRPLVRREQLVAYTPVAVCRAYFHMAAEASLHDFLEAIPGTLLTVTEARIFPLVELPAPFPAEAELLLVGRSHLQFYHEP